MNISEFSIANGDAASESTISLSHMLGDLLVAFGGSITNPPGRSTDARWLVARRTAGWMTWECLPTVDWKGIPVNRIENQGWYGWVLGGFINLEAVLSNAEDFPTTIERLQQIAATLNRRFFVLAWHSSTQEWHAWTDRFGTIHAYYACDGRRAAIGTFMPAVAAAASQRRLDWEALAGFFNFGFFPNDRTHFDDVKILRPASHYVFDQDGRLLKHERYWEWHHAPDQGRSYDESVDQFAHIFQQVMDDQTREGRVAVPISGGLDSRATVAALTRPGEIPGDRLWAYSYGYSDDSVETRIARRAAKARRLPFQAFTIQPYLFEELERLLAWTEGFTDITQARQASVRDVIAARADHLVAALWGDVWLDDMGLIGEAPEALDAGAVQRYAQKKMQKSGGWLLENLARPRLGQVDLGELFASMVQEEMIPLGRIADPDFRVKAYKTEQWSFRWSLPPIRVFQSAAWPLLVFYDQRLADFFCTLPSSYVSQRRLQIDYLKRCASDLARITWQVYDASLYNYQHFNTRLLPKRALKKVWRTLTRQQILQRNWEVQFLNESGRAGLERWLLRNGLKLHEFITPGAVRELLETFYTDPLGSRQGYTTSMLLTFSTWLEFFGE